MKNRKLKRRIRSMIKTLDKIGNSAEEISKTAKRMNAKFDNMEGGLTKCIHEIEIEQECEQCKEVFKGSSMELSHRVLKHLTKD